MRAAVLTSRPDAPWLPPGGRADVVLDPGGTAPAPTGLVRLLLRHGDEVFCVPRDDGTGRLDLPTRTVADAGDGHATVTALARDVLALATEPQLVGYVRNVVAAPTPCFPWPTPDCHFTVWQADGAPQVSGTWLPAGPGSALSERHWWPLLAATPSQTGTPAL
ncbi:hypothetical protein [Isoptericola dokdonensis]|uniref:NUDIX domain protein n=1 Tax=Isoptericola dokdonensis DS-3 TaxID=1300344 RepID=A0A161HVQ0_9MICO|nr:hypothetical protein [Isoptericola dokdonensis]ANC30213.1 hypothetical protein I598_0633 [Isoptericola dokdonensis DS-3]